MKFKKIKTEYTTRIPDGAFYSNKKMLGSYELPTNIESIGEFAFGFCDNIFNIYIPKSVQKIDDFAFYGCNNLVIYCELDKKPKNWGNNWNYNKLKVVWGYKNGRIN